MINAALAPKTPVVVLWTVDPTCVAGKSRREKVTASRFCWIHAEAMATRCLFHRVPMIQKPKLRLNHGSGLSTSLRIRMERWFEGKGPIKVRANGCFSCSHEICWCQEFLSSSYFIVCRASIVQVSGVFFYGLLPYSRYWFETCLFSIQFGMMKHFTPRLIVFKRFQTTNQDMVFSPSISLRAWTTEPWLWQIERSVFSQLALWWDPCPDQRQWLLSPEIGRFKDSSASSSKTNPKQLAYGTVCEVNCLRDRSSDAVKHAHYQLWSPGALEITPGSMGTTAALEITPRSMGTMVCFQLLDLYSFIVALQVPSDNIPNFCFCWTGSAVCAPCCEFLRLQELNWPSTPLNTFFEYKQRGRTFSQPGEGPQLLTFDFKHPGIYSWSLSKDHLKLFSIANMFKVSTLTLT